MIAAGRLRTIEEMVKKEGFVSIGELARKLKMSASTIRRDITVLEKENVLLRCHGGVIIADQINVDLVSARENRNLNVKRKIGEAAANLVEDGDIIYMDSSTTVLEMARNLKSDIDITAVTNDLAIALELEKKPAINTIVLGGTLRQGTHSLIGPLAEANIKNMFIGKMFIGAGGISLEGQIIYYNLQAIELRRKIMSVSDRVILLVDSSKFQKKGFAAVATLNQLHSVVTDEIPEKIADLLLKSNVKIIAVK